MKPPPPFTATVDAAKEWPQWRDHFRFYLEATKKGKERKSPSYGKEAVLKTLPWAEPFDKDKLDKVIEGGGSLGERADKMNASQ